MPGSIGNALRLGMDMGDYGQRQAMNAEALKARKFQNALLPEERTYQVEERGIKRDTAAESAKQQKAKFGAEMVEKTLPRVTYENYSGWRQAAISQWGVPERMLPPPEVFPDTEEGRSKFTMYSKNLYVKALEIQGKKEAAQIAADRARDTAGIGAAARIKAAEIGAGKSRETAEIGAKSRIEAAKIRAANSGKKPPTPLEAQAKIADVRKAMAQISRKPTGPVDPKISALALQFGYNLMQGTELDPEKVKGFNAAAEKYIARLQKIIDGEFGPTAPPAPGASTTPTSPYKTKEDVRAAYAAKKITREQAADILRKQFGFK